VKDAWVRVDSRILDDRDIVELPDSQWREMIEGIVNDPQNVHCDPEPTRRSWNIVSKLLRPFVFKRDKPICQHCGSTQNLEIDHIIPLARGGTNDPDNLQVLCKKCNQRKWAKL
jgi:hypothetical protein